MKTEPSTAGKYAKYTMAELKQFCRERYITWRGRPSHYMLARALARWDNGDRG